MTTIAIANNKAWFMVKVCLGLILLSLIFPAFQQNAHATSNGQQITFDKEEYTVREDAGFISIPIKRLGGDVGVVGVTYCTCNDTAVAPDDFIHSSGTMIFYNKDETIKEIKIKIIDDDYNEGEEQFFVRLITPSGGAQLGAIKKITVKIIDNDPEGGTPPPKSQTPTPPTPTTPTPTTPTPNQVSPDPDYASSLTAIANPTPEASASPSPTVKPTSTPTSSPTATPAPKAMSEEPAVVKVSGSVAEMPNTATPWYNYIVVGSLLVLLSGTMLYRRIAAFRRE